MRKINAVPVCLLFFATTVHAVTIEEIAARNNRLIELDQEIAIAEKNKKLAEIRSSSAQPETIALPKMTAVRGDENLAVVSVHGTSANPVVDVQYGDSVLQKKLGEALPHGWQITAIGNDSVTFRKKIGRGPEIFKTVGIGHGNRPDAEPGMLSGLIIAAPAHAGN